MNVKELRELIKDVDDETPIWISVDLETVRHKTDVTTSADGGFVREGDTPRVMILGDASYSR